jgi:AcrR family transcriptional regulator
MNQHSTSDKIPKTKRGRKTREKLLHAAEAEFGERGFPEASIASITQRAGVALGTFYVYFESKEEIFRALVSYMGELTRQWIGERVAESPDRLAAERRGVEAFIEFVRTHRNLYRVVSMAQFVAEDADSEVWSWALIGMTVFLGMRFADWDEDRPADEVAGAVADLISTGMAKH